MYAEEKTLPDAAPMIARNVPEESTTIGVALGDIIRDARATPRPHLGNASRPAPRVRPAGRPIDPTHDPIRVHPDRDERWIALRGQQTMSLDEAREAIARAAAEDGAREDIGAGALDKVAVSYDSTGLLHVCKTRQVGDRLEPASAPIPLRAHAYGQLCARANAPAEYLSRLPAKIARAALQHGLMSSGADKTGMIRLAGGEARAIVSGQYSAADDETILDILDHCLTRHGIRGDVRVRGVATGARTILRLTIPTDVRAPKKGDLVEYGLDVVNGELGNSSIAIDPVTVRLICTNGARGSVYGDRRRMNHRGDPGRLVETIYDAIPAALNEAQGQIDMMRRAADRMIDDLDGEFQLLTGRVGLSVSESREVARTVMAERSIALPERTSDWGDILRGITDVSAYDVLNGITAYAQTRPAARRLDLESAAVEYGARRAR
jgi:hypothetical protein